MNSGTSLRLTRELLLCCCEQEGKHQNENPFSVDTLTSLKNRRKLVSVAYFDKVLELFVLLLQLFEDIYSLSVMAAEFSIQLFHLLRIFIRKLRKKIAITMYILIYICICMFMWAYASFTNLLEQNISNLMDEVISGVLWLGCSLSAVLQGSKEISVKEQQGVQAREDFGHAVPVELQLLQHASPEHLGHDRQRLDVVQLCLHQLCMGTVIVGMVIGADGCDNLRS